ncbi:MAG: class I SAM-dependent methyltransferase, partial [Bacteroidia bacterium]
MSVTPYQNPEASKRVQVEEMFDNIAPKYDLLNRLMSAGVDISWRRKAIKLLAPYSPKRIVDIATGTGDFAIEAAKLKPDEIIGIDISNEMLRVGREKMVKKGLDKLIDMRNGDSEDLELKTDSVDAITVGFGVRNFQNLPKGMGEILRVLKPGG